MSVKDKPLSRQERRRRERQKELVRQQRGQSGRRWSIIGGIIILVLVLGGGGYFLAGALSPKDKTAQPGAAIDGITCQAEMLQYHYHAHLAMYWNGRPVALPAQIGIPYNTAIPLDPSTNTNSCLYWLHTHDTRGVIHIETPNNQTFTLGNFFDIWHYTSIWDAQGGLGASVDASFLNALQPAYKVGNVHVFVDGKPYTADYRTIKLTAHELITIEIGRPVRPPTSFTFAPGE